MKCQLDSSCNNPAVMRITYCHEDERLRWSSIACRECAAKASGGSGEFVYAMLWRDDSEPPKTDLPLPASAGVRQ